MDGTSPDAPTPVEQIALEQSPFELLYPPAEKVPTITVGSFPALGRLTAMRFIEWVQHNPGGVVALPTGQTPRYFIEYTEHLLKTWARPETRRELEEHGLDPNTRPEMGRLKLVQIDEFYPMNPRHHNSYHYYLKRYYIEPLGLDPEKAMLIDGTRVGVPEGEDLDSVWPEHEVDLSLRYRAPRSHLEEIQRRVLLAVDQWCQRYEERIREMGGIGFFLGGIGPDGHIAFNVRGSDHHSTTRLTRTNHETQAAAAVDLGGIEVARRRLAITVGLGTITYNPDCTALIIAAGSAKAGVVADAVQREPNILYPATALQALPGARFYVTRGAAEGLMERQLAALTAAQRVGQREADRAVVDLCTRLGRPLHELTEEDFAGDRFAAAILSRRTERAGALAAQVRGRLIERVEHGCSTLKSTRFLHSEPHHDDIMLGYLPYVVRHVRDATNLHHFVTMTSGFRSVTNKFMSQQLKWLERFLGTEECRRLVEGGYFHGEEPLARNRDVWQYLDGVAADNERMKNEGIARRMLRNLVTLYREDDLEELRNRAEELRHYFATQYPGGKDPEPVQQLKGMRREWEAECLWGYFGWSCGHIHHLRLGFYTGDIFNPEPAMGRDVEPILRLLNRARPDVLTVALDPEATGPDTHYRALQATTEALKRYQAENPDREITIWGYRNVWHRFHPAEADIFVPVSLNMFAVMESAFHHAFLSQREAPFPSYEYDGPFNELAQRVQVEQYQALKTCLGREWFYEHPSPLVRATRGLVFLKEMTPAEFYEHSRGLRRVAEGAETLAEE